MKSADTPLDKKFGRLTTGGLDAHLLMNPLGQSNRSNDSNERMSTKVDR